MNIANLFKNVLLASHPVGSIYITTDGSFNPHEKWGGSWELLKDRFLVGAGSSYTLGASGGEATHTLTVNEMPSHAHRGNIYNAGSGNTYNHVTWGTCGTDNIAGTAVGGGQPHNNLPPYRAVNMWLRTA